MRTVRGLSKVTQLGSGNRGLCTQSLPPVCLLYPHPQDWTSGGAYKPLSMGTGL